MSYKIPQKNNFAIVGKLQVFDASTSTVVPFTGTGAVVTLIGENDVISEVAYTQEGSEITISDPRFRELAPGNYTLAVVLPIDSTNYSGLYNNFITVGDRTYRPEKFEITLAAGAFSIGAPAPVTPTKVIKIEGSLAYGSIPATAGTVNPSTNSIKLTEDGVEVTSGVTWAWTSSQSWAQVASGKTGVLTVSANTGTSARTASITPKATYGGKSYSGTAVSISQAAPASDVWTVEGSFSYSGKVAAAGGSTSAPTNSLVLKKNGTAVTATKAYSATVPSGGSIDASTGVVTFPAYTGTTDRSVTVTCKLTAEGHTESKTAAATQEGAVATPDTFYWCAATQTQPMTGLEDINEELVVSAEIDASTLRCDFTNAKKKTRWYLLVYPAKFSLKTLMYNDAIKDDITSKLGAVGTGTYKGVAVKFQACSVAAYDLNKPFYAIFQ